MTRTTLTLVVGLALVAVAVAATLSGSPVAVVRTNGVLTPVQLATTTNGAGACQGGETLPAGISQVRLTLVSDAGPRMTVTALSGARVLTSGVVGNSWLGGSVAVGVRPLARATPGVRICFKFGPTQESVAIIGEPTSRAVAARSLEGRAMRGRFRIEYLARSSRSWWSQASGVARRMGLGRAPSGAPVVLLLIAAMAAALAAGSWLARRELS